MPVTPPTTPIFSSALTLGASIKVMLGLTNGEIGSAPIDWVNNNPGGLACRWAPAWTPAGGGSSIGEGLGMGPPPLWTAGGFAPAGGALVGNCLTFVQGTCGLRVPNGIPTTLQNQKTLGLIFRHRCPPTFGAHGVPLRQMWGFSFEDGIQIYNDQIGVLRGQGSSIWMPGQSGAQQNLASMAPTYNHWTALVVANDDSTSPRTRLLFMYDFDTQTAHPNSGQGGQVDSGTWTVPTGSEPGLNSQYVAPNGTMEQLGFVGDVAHAFIDFKTWAAADFANYIADPWSCLRGASTVRTAGSLSWSAGSIQYNDATTTTVTMNGAPPIGTGTGGTGVPSIQAYRATTSNFTPGAGNLIASNITFPFTDTPPAGSYLTPYYYQFVATDGSSSVTHPQQAPASVLNKGDVLLLVIGDSVGTAEIPSIWQTVTSLAAAEGVRFNTINLSDSGAGLNSGTATLSWLPTTSMTAVNEVQALAMTNGTATGGTFTLTIPGVGTSAPIAWNATAANVVTALSGLGTATASGGPFPATPINITFSGSPWAATALALGQTVSSLTGGTQVWGTAPQVAVSRTTAGVASGTSSNLFTLGTAQFTAAAALFPSQKQIVHILFGGNEARSGYTAANYSTYLAAQIAALKTILPSAKIVVANPYMQAGQANPTTTQQAQIALMQGYAAAIAANVDNVTVFQGDMANFALSVRTPKWWFDFLHPDQNSAAPAVAYNLYVNGIKPLVNLSSHPVIVA